MCFTPKATTEDADRHTMENISRVVGRVQEIQARLNMPSQNGAFAELLDAAQPAAAPSVMERGHHASPGVFSLGTVFGVNGPIPVAPTTGSIDTYLEVHGIADRNGRLESHELVEVSGGWHGSGRLLPPAAQAWESMRAAAAQDGIDLYAIDTYRSYDVQAHAHGEYLAGRKDSHVLPPGHSEHGYGLAVDITNGALVGPGDAEWHWMTENGARFGWHPISNESWHWEFRG